MVSAIVNYPQKPIFLNFTNKKQQNRLPFCTQSCCLFLLWYITNTQELFSQKVSLKICLLSEMLLDNFCIFFSFAILFKNRELFSAHVLLILSRKYFFLSILSYSPIDEINLNISLSKTNLCFAWRIHVSWYFLTSIHWISILLKIAATTYTRITPEKSWLSITYFWINIPAYTPIGDNDIPFNHNH